MPNSVHNLIIITGGPGSGKSTLIAALAAVGFDTAPEAGRAVIQQQVRIGGAAHNDPDRFAELMLSWDMRSYDWAWTRGALVFFDHGIPGLPALYLMEGRGVPVHIEAAVTACRYHSTVFVTPPWREIYRNDEQRRQTWTEAVAVHRAVRETYTRYGYRLVELPCDTVAARMEFLMCNLAT